MTFSDDWSIIFVAGESSWWRPPFLEQKSFTWNIGEEMSLEEPVFCNIEMPKDVRLNVDHPELGQWTIHRKDASSFSINDLEKLFEFVKESAYKHFRPPYMPSEEHWDKLRENYNERLQMVAKQDGM